MAITFTHKGDFSKTMGLFERCKEVVKLGNLDKYGRAGVEALRKATPKDSGETAASWDYRIVRQNGSARIEWINSNVVDGAVIAVLLQYGHGTKNGGWVEGRDYINPAIRPIFDEIAENAWRGITGR